MREFLVLACLFWMPPFLVFLRNVLWDLYLWQLKEFRWDRFWVYIRWDQEESNRKTGYIALKFLFFALVSQLFKYDLLAMTGIFLAYSLWFNQAINFLYSVFTNQARRPSAKNIRSLIIIAFVSIIFITITLFITLPFAGLERENISYENIVPEISTAQINRSAFIYPDVYLFLGLSTLVGILLDLCTPFLVAIGVGITYPIARIKRQLLIHRAKKFLKKNNPDLVIIGITGSEGKTTTKEILYAILSKKYKVAKTPKNLNTDVGLAKAILQTVTKDTQIFIAEMGAYRKGEIKAATKHFPPEIAIVTSLDRQHIGIFGSKENLFAAKSEIVKGLQQDGVAILNADNEQIRDMHELFTGKSIFVTQNSKIFKKTISKKDPELSAIWVENTLTSKSKIQFKLHTIDEESKFTIKTPLDHLVINFALSIATARELNMSTKEIAKALEELDIKLPRLEISNGDNNTTILNDTYNSSFNGFIAAIKTMNKMRHPQSKRIVVAKGIYELGRYKKETYEELFAAIRNKYDVLITEDSLLAMLAKKNNTHAQIFKYSTPEEAIEIFWKIVEKGDTILLEGRLHPKIIQEIISENT
jgi:UDP-N-acetylmuramoyl-tripeptide--D-alanyl-D-alanine ligase